MLGLKWFLWPFPAAASGDGIKFRMRPNAHPTWPPKQYYLYKKYPYGKPRKENGNPHVRRGSEGYIVKHILPEEREFLVNMSPQESKEYYSILNESSTDFDSLEDERESEGIPRLDVEDSESLLDVQNRLKRL